jgi:type IV pilus assembly protein PilN
MSLPSWLESDWDLLRHRRLERGLPAVESLAPARGLLARGALLGGGLCAAALVMWALVLVRQGQVDQQLQGLRGIPAQVQALEARALTQRRQLSGLKRSNEALAKGLVAVSSGSALLAQLAAVTPEGVQLTEVQVQGGALKLKGVAVDPQAFRRVNALSLLLAQSPLFEASGVAVVKLSRDGSKGAAEPVSWELTAGFAKLPVTRQVQLLRQLGADGMVQRLLILQRAGLLP